MSQNRGIRIGIDAANIRHGGGRTHLIELLQAADPIRDGFLEVYVWGSEETLSKLPKYHWLKKEFTSALGGSLFRRILWQKFFLGKALRDLNCDVLFVPGGSFSTNFHSIVSMSQNILPFEWRELWRYGISLLTLKLILLRFTQTFSFRKAHGVIFLTDYARRGVLKVTGPLNGVNRIIPHGLNPRFLISDDDFLKRTFPANGKPIRLVYVSMIDQYKHQWHVVEAVAKVRKVSGFELQLDLIGPSYTPALKRLNSVIAKLDPYGKWVHYHGAIDYQQLHSIYGESNIGIWASSCETFGLILLEMMGAGLPILCSDRGPMPEILGDAGLYFDPEKPENLSSTLLKLLASEERITSLALNSYQKAKVFSWDRCAEDTFGFLRQVANLNRQAV